MSSHFHAAQSIKRVMKNASSMNSYVETHDGWFEGFAPLFGRLSDNSHDEKWTDVASCVILRKVLHNRCDNLYGASGVILHECTLETPFQVLLAFGGVISHDRFLCE